MVGGKESHVPQKLLTRDEVAEWLQISTVQLWRLTNVQGVIPYVRIGTKGIRFREADIEAYLAKGMNKAR
jgi:excisionase family DNA binding protein